MIIKTCCFVGHRKIAQTDEIKERLYNEIEKLITKDGVAIFLFGSRSQFNELCKKIVADLKEKYPKIKRVYVRAEYEKISEDYKNYLLEEYEETYYPKKLFGSGRASYVERNQIMINDSDYCIFYYDKTYLPPKCKSIYHSAYERQPKSGTKIAYDYAVRKRKNIINIAEG